MPYTRITATAFGKAAIDYALGGKEGKGHNNNEKRNLFVTTVGMFPNQPPSYADQMNEYWSRASSRNKNQVRRIVLSFSEQELDPKDPNSALIAGEISREFAEKYYPNRQTLICVQNDGEGGKLHCHIIVNNVSMTDFKGCSDEQTKFTYVAKGADEIAKKYIDVDMDYKDIFDKKTSQIKLSKDKVSRHVRRMRQENQEAIKNGEDAPHYIWEDDLKSRIKLAMNEATSRDDFFSKLNDRGVTIVRNGTLKRHGEYFTYSMQDASKIKSEDEIPKGKRKIRSDKLGGDYMPKALDEKIAEKQNDNQATAYYDESEVISDAPAISESEKKELEEEAREFSEWATQNKYIYLSDDGDFDLDAYERAQEAYKAFKRQPKTDVPEISSAPNLGILESAKEHRKVTPSKVPEKASGSTSYDSYTQKLIDKINHDVAQMDMSLDSIPDDEDFFGS
ncbi:relaxase/mobilization nuclease domain-containing protein [Butyrivibrio sp. AC2005]|uniref:relaxase/mobilization nuclease domain-containing protein n=1 Tax=Butyrivibrio sp. AC2005 TaxID=1280672 RepID=UPI0003FE0D26|nr:relaxase/mobilization nuclease domain-containing protein [Butyrivibrio sp. AC2005]